MATVRVWQAAGLASMLEVLLVAALVVAVTTAPPLRSKPTYTPLLIEVLVEPPPVVEPPKPEPPKMVEPKPLDPPKPKPIIKTEPEPLPPPVPVVTSQPVENPIPVPPPVVATPKEEVDPALAYNAELTKAVQAVFRVPGTASAMGFKGRARVQFALKDAKVSAIMLLESSTLGAVDRAALKAVESANYPSPPDSLRGQLRTYQIWVECF